MRWHVFSILAGLALLALVAFGTRSIVAQTPDQDPCEINPQLCK